MSSASADAGGDPDRPEAEADHTPDRTPDRVSDRAAFRAFVRRNHPDVGGDPEVFRRGLEAFRATRADASMVLDPSKGWTSVAVDDPRLDGPITAVPGDPLHRLGRAGQKVWSHRPFRRGSGRVI